MLQPPAEDGGRSTRARLAEVHRAQPNLKDEARHSGKPRLSKEQSGRRKQIIDPLECRPDREVSRSDSLLLVPCKRQNSNYTHLTLKCDSKIAHNSTFHHRSLSQTLTVGRN